MPRRGTGRGEDSRGSSPTIIPLFPPGSVLVGHEGQVEPPVSTLQPPTPSTIPSHLHHTSSTGAVVTSAAATPPGAPVEADRKKAVKCKAIPWVLYPTDEDRKSDYQGTAADWIVETLLEKFWKCAREKMTELNSLPLESSVPLPEIFTPSHDTSFHQIITAIGEVRLVSCNKSAFEVMMAALIQWKTAQRVPLDHLKILVEGSGTRISLKDGQTFLEERYQSGVEYTFLLSALACLDSFVHDEIPEYLCNQLLDLSIEYLTRPERKFGPEPFFQEISQNKKRVHEIYAWFIGAISKSRLKQVTARYLKELPIPITNSTKSKALVLIPSLRFVSLRLDSKHRLTATSEFLAFFAGHLKYEPLRSYAKELRVAFIDTLVLLLRPLAAVELKSGLKYIQWFSTVNELIACAIKMKERKPKDRKTQYVYSLKFIIPVLWTYLTKYEEPQETINVVYEKLIAVTGLLFPPQKKLIPEVFDQYVDLIHCIAEARPDFALHNIIFELLKFPDLKTFEVDRMIVGLRSLQSILAAQEPPHTQSKAKPLANLIKEKVEFHHTRRKIRVDPYLKHTSILIGNVFTAVETLRSPVSPVKVAFDPALLLQLHQLAISCIPLVLPIKIIAEDLVLALVKNLIHSDRIIRDASYNTLMQLITWYPHLRAEIVQGIAGYIVQEIPDHRAPDLSMLLFRLGNCLNQWKIVLSEPQEPPPNVVNIVMSLLQDAKHSGEVQELPCEFDIAFLEAVALVFLCCPFGKLRESCLHILQSVSVINSIQEQNSDTLPAPRVIDVIEEEEAVVLQILASTYDTFHFATIHEDVQFLVQLSIRQIAISDLPKHQFMWTYCYCELLKRIMPLCPEQIQIAWDLATQRLSAVRPDDNPSKLMGSIIESPTNCLWWRNYCMFGCTCISPRKAEPQQPSQPATNPQREFLTSLCQHLRSTSEQQRDVAMQSLQQVNINYLGMLFELLKPFEADLRVPSRKKKDVMRNMLALLRCRLCETMRQTTLGQSELYCQLYLEWIQESFTFLNQPNEWIWDGVLFMRFYFCVVVQHFARELNLCGRNQIIPPALRRDIFLLLSRWTHSEKLLDNDQTKKRLATELASYIKEPEKRPEVEDKVVERTLYLQYAASNAIASLLLGPSFSVDVLRDPNNIVFTWADNIFLTDTVQPSTKNKPKWKKARDLNVQCTVSAVQSLVKGNPEIPDLFHNILDRCYSNNSQVSKAYFIAVVELAKTTDLLAFPSSMSLLLHLILFKAGDPTLVIRQAAQQLLQLITDTESVYLPFASESRLPETYMQAQYGLSTTLATTFSTHSYAVLTETVKRLILIASGHEKLMLTYILPWLERMDLAEETVEKFNAVENLLLLTWKYKSTFPLEIKSIWTTIAVKSYAVHIVIDIMVELGLRK
ncbi:Cell morphogenesis protein PAG1, partial [Pelomyxa schiedti]